MDMYDIYKKLTRYCNIPRRKKSQGQSNKTAPKTEIVVKTEEVKVEPREVNSGADGIPVSTLFGEGSSSPKRGKKRKHLSEEELERKQKLLKQEEVNHYRNVNNIKVVGKHVPEPAKTFNDFKVKPDLIENLKKCGYVEPTSIQKQAIPIMLEGRQILACAPTGSGKTAAFLIPIIQELKGPEKQGFRALILCPTRELAKQTQRECMRLSEGRNLRIHVMSKVKNALTSYGPKSSQKFDILITTPNRLCYLLKQDPPAVSLANIKWFVIDEADKLFEDGTRSFREQLDEILVACSNSDRKVAMFSATHTPVVAKWCVHNMKGLARVTVGHRNAATDTVDQEMIFAGDDHGKLIGFRNLVRKGIGPPVLIFVQTKEKAKLLFKELIYDGIMVATIHSDMTQTQRDKTVTAFREGTIWVLICTELMARGIDFKGVNLVINYDMPPSTISYIHRVGRAGRAGERGKAITYFTHEDPNLRSIAHVVHQSGGSVPEYLLTLKKAPKSKKRQLKIQAKRKADAEKAKSKFRANYKFNNKKRTANNKPKQKNKKKVNQQS